MTSAAAPVIEARDPLAEALGAVEPDGTFRYTYEDAVRLAGHSCPTVAGAYMMTAMALARLYADSLPVRGEVEVVVGGDPADGRAGPMSQVVTLLTGAAPETGFHGLFGRWRRASLLRFDAALGGSRIRYRRTDTGAAVEASYDPGTIPPAPEIAGLLTATLSGTATPGEAARFRELWQARVAAILGEGAGRAVKLRDLGRIDSVHEKR